MKIKMRPWGTNIIIIQKGFGKPIAILIIVGVTFGQWNSLMGILGISSNIIFEMLALYSPSLNQYKYELVLAIAVSVISIMYAIMLIGKYSLFEKILVMFVSCMGISFVFSLLVVHPMPAEVAAGFVPSIPNIEGGKMMVAAFVGTRPGARRPWDQGPEAHGTRGPGAMGPGAQGFMGPGAQGQGGPKGPWDQGPWVNATKRCCARLPHKFSRATRGRLRRGRRRRCPEPMKTVR